MSNLKLIEVVKKSSGDERQSLYNHTDITTALAAMENDFGAQVKDDTTNAIYCILIDNETGARIDGLYFVATTPASEEGEEPVEFDTSIRSRVYTHNDYQDDNIAAYETERLAVGNYHTKKAAAMNKAECNKAITILIDGKGEFVEFSNWERPEA